MEQQDMPIYILLKVVLFSILPYRVRAEKLLKRKVSASDTKFRSEEALDTFGNRQFQE